MTADPDLVPSLRDWAFAAYTRPGVEEACLELQDRDGMDVVALLWCIWMGEHHGAIDAEAIGRIVADVGSWQAEVVAPLRSVRRRLSQTEACAGSAGAGAGPAVGDDAGAAAQERLRRQVADAELAAEVIQLDRLESSTRAASEASAIIGPPGDLALRANLACFDSVGGYGPDTDRAAAIEALLAALVEAGR